MERPDISSVAARSLQCKMSIKETLQLCKTLGRGLTITETNQLKEIRRNLRKKSWAAGF